MRKCIAVLVLLAAVSGYAADTIYSANIVGFQKLEFPVSGRYNLVSINFVGGSGAGLRLSEIFSDVALIYSPRAANADRITVWSDADQVYYTYYQRDDTGLFYEVSDKKNPVDPEILPGQGFWLYPSRNRAESLEFVVSGDVPLYGTLQINLDEGLAMMGTPFAADFELNDPSIDWVAAGATGNARASDADRITTWDGTRYVEYYFNNGAWYNVSDKQLATDKVSFGKGFFYHAKGTVILNLTSPY